MNARFNWLMVVLGSAAAAVSAAHALPNRIASPAVATVFDYLRRLDANQINLRATSDGSLAYDPPNGSAGLEFPRGSNRFALFATGPWLTAGLESRCRHLRGADPPGRALGQRQGRRYSLISPARRV